MTTYYRWHTLEDNSNPPNYTNEFGETHSLSVYETEYDAIKGLKDYLTWECPVHESEFVLYKVYRK